MAPRKKTPEEIVVQAESHEEEKHEEREPEQVAQKPTVAPVEQREAPPEIETVEQPIVNVRIFPQIRVGVCEFHGTPHGIIDADTLKGKCWHNCKTDPFCPHSKTGCEVDTKGQAYHSWMPDGYCRHEHNYNQLKIRCTFCPVDADMRSVIKSRIIYVYSSPFGDPKKLVMVCADFRCRDKFFKRITNAVVG